MTDKPISFVDVETTGTNAYGGKIIEIGIIRTVGSVVVQEYQTLINPGLRIDPFIEKITGISSIDLENAPSFEAVKDKIFEILNDSIFVAHNVRFDYGFVRNEFKRVGINFTSKHFDTVKLAKILYPGHTHYNLDALTRRHGIVIQNRHRAFGDAEAIWNFFKLSKQNINSDIFEEALKRVLKKPSIPPNIPSNVIDNLPEEPGVYIFQDNVGMPLYIGKSINIKERVLSHFANDYTSQVDMKISQSAKSIEFIETAGDFSALLLESKLIKKHKPLFNKALRESGGMVVVLKSTDERGYNTIVVKKMKDIGPQDISNILVVYKSKAELKKDIAEICKLNSLCPKIMGIESSSGFCFYYQIKNCKGACGGEEWNLKYNLRFDEAFFNKKIKKWKFDGPVLIKENGKKSEVHVVDNWCYLGNIKDDSDSLDKLDAKQVFDYDTYKILKRYLSNPRNLRNVSYYYRGKKDQDFEISEAQ